ncbi:MAG: TraR/DksA family transcriptional regulator [Pseudomonadales bacterium]|nr:TraR/DksA family transcriptional regulator [Pseudomonadales bacterium]
MDIKQFESELIQLKSELQSRVSRTHKHIYQKDQPVSANFNEQIKETENDGLVMALEAEGLEEIAQIDRALSRIQDGSFGQCQNCGKAIDEARLEAIPYTSNCIACAS